MAKDKIENRVQKAFDSMVNPKPKRPSKKARELTQREQRTARRIQTLIKRASRRPA